MLSKRLTKKVAEGKGIIYLNPFEETTNKESIRNGESITGKMYFK
jgi:hypothetical protein